MVAGHQLVGVGNGHGRQQKGDVNRRLRNQHAVGVVAGIDEGFPPRVRLVVASDFSRVNRNGATFHAQKTSFTLLPEFKEQALLKARHRGVRSALSLTLSIQAA